VPFANLVRPYQAMREIDKASDPKVAFDEASWAAPHSAPILGWWWGLWLLNNVVGRFTMRMEESDTLQEMLFSLPIGMFECLLGIVLALVAAAMIRRINSNQLQKAGRNFVNASVGEFR
jgi:ABC-type Fe3+ transport system permease subunit